LRSARFIVSVAGLMAVILITAAPATMASATTSVHHSVAEISRVQAAPTNCPPDYCDYTYTGYSHLCLFSEANISNWGSCRNVDESFFNRPGYVVRLYYSPNYAGAWVCFPQNTGISNLAGYTFNNGPGRAGYGARVENDVASSALYQGSCSNPI
jgi:hypothetical protein